MASIKLAQQPLDLFSLGGKVAELVHEAEERDVRLKLSGPSDGATITGDADPAAHRVRRDFPGDSARKARPATVVAERRLETRDGQPRALLIVADEGRVQEAYDREPGPFDEKRGGLGLALPLARRVIEGHGGRIWSPANTSGNADSPDPLVARLGHHLVPSTELKR